MTDTGTLDRQDTLYITDAELIRRMGVPEKIARPVLLALDNDRRSGFPKKQELWGNRRYWPAVKAYLDRTNGLTMAASPNQRRP
jgi:hypothetical protein